MTQTTENSDHRVAEGIKRATDLNANGETELAVQHLMLLIEEFPAAAGLHGYAAMFLSRAGRLDEAIEYARQAVELSPMSEKASFVLFVALCETEQYIEALDEMKRLLTLRPSEEYTEMIKQWNLDE